MEAGVQPRPDQPAAGGMLAGAVAIPMQVNGHVLELMLSGIVEQVR